MPVAVVVLIKPILIVLLVSQDLAQMRWPAGELKRAISIVDISFCKFWLIQNSIDKVSNHKDSHISCRAWFLLFNKVGQRCVIGCFVNVKFFNGGAFGGGLGCFWFRF